MTRDTSRPLPLFAAARGVFGLTLDGMIWTRRSLLMALLIGLPAALSVLYRAFLVAKLPERISGWDLYGSIVAIYYIRNVVPLVALFYATSLVADEVEGRTITYLFTRPIRRGSILLGKFAAYVVTTLVLTLPAVVVTFFLLTTVRGWGGVGASVPDLLRDMGAIAAGLVSYGALFTLMGVLMRRPVIPGLLFLFVWEWMANLPGYLPRFTITGWLRSLVSHRPAEEGGLVQILGQAVESLPWDLAALVLTLASGSFLMLALRIFSSREYVLEQ